MITFEPIEDKEIKKRTGQTIYTKVRIRDHMSGKEIGHIFSPGGSGEDIENAIQVCGFTEAFDLWGCGIYHGYKDIQLLFDEGIMGGKTNHNLSKCCRCYRNPCQCENKIRLTKDQKKGIEETGKNNIVRSLPFNIKSSWDEEFKERLEKRER